MKATHVQPISTSMGKLKSSEMFKGQVIMVPINIIDWLLPACMNKF